MKNLIIAFTLLLLTSQAFAAENKKNDIPPSKPAVISGFADIVEDLMPTVVNISAIQEVQTGNVTVDQIVLGELPKTPLFDDLRRHLENQYQGQKKKISSIGSGFIISKDGFIVTNNHVIEDADEITVGMDDGSKYKAKVVGIDRKTDIALLKINAEKELKSIKFGDSNKARIGDWMIVIGNPYGLGGSVSVGILSARGRDIKNGQNDDFLQTDAAINKGNSGGPMFNARGEVIGMSTAIFSPSGGNVGIGFATPSNSVVQVIRQLKERGEVTRGWIGVSVQDVPDDIAESMKLEKSRGAFVVDLVKGGPADKAGILPTDIILKFDDQEIIEMKTLPKTVSQYPIGQTAKIVVWRQGKAKTLKIKVEKMREEPIKTSETKTLEKKQAALKPTGQLLGLGLAEFKSKIKKDKNELSIEGLLVVEVNPKSEAAEKGVAIGDVIVSVNQIPITSVDQIKEIIEEAKKASKKIFIFAKRGDANYAITLNIGS
ncbi:MAG: Do family serine endopeptidase [Proteobacteria bacterium]|nr:Do family serine endopeptidase [Pseudomonadota bacterium]